MSGFEFRYNIACYKDPSSTNNRWMYNIFNKDGIMFGTNDTALDIIPERVHTILVKNDVESDYDPLSKNNCGLFTAQIKFTITHTISEYTDNALCNHGFKHMGHDSTSHEYLWGCTASSSEKCRDVVTTKLASIQDDPKGGLPIIFKALAADANAKLCLYGEQHVYCVDGMNIASILITFIPPTMEDIS